MGLISGQRKAESLFETEKNHGQLRFRVPQGGKEKDRFPEGTHLPLQTGEGGPA